LKRAPIKKILILVPAISQNFQNSPWLDLELRDQFLNIFLVPAIMSCFENNPCKKIKN
jgi:hypothetical protein